MLINPKGVVVCLNRPKLKIYHEPVMSFCRYVLKLKLRNWENESVSEWASERRRDSYCYRHCCGMCGGVFVVCKVFGRGRDLKRCWATSELQVPPPVQTLVFAFFALKGQLLQSVSGLAPLSILWLLLSLLVRLMLTHRLRTHTLTDSSDCKGCYLPPLMILLSCCPSGPCVVSEASWRATWQYVSWASGWDEVSEQAERFALKGLTWDQCVSNHQLSTSSV